MVRKHISTVSGSVRLRATEATGRLAAKTSADELRVMFTETVRRRRRQQTKSRDERFNGNFFGNFAGSPARRTEY